MCCTHRFRTFTLEPVLSVSINPVRTPANIYTGVHNYSDGKFYGNRYPKVHISFACCSPKAVQIKCYSCTECIRVVSQLGNNIFKLQPDPMEEFN